MWNVDTYSVLSQYKPYQNTRTCSDIFLALPVRDLLRTKPQYTSQTIATYTQKPSSLFTRAEALAHAANDQRGTSLSLLIFYAAAVTAADFAVANVANPRRRGPADTICQGSAQSWSGTDVFQMCLLFHYFLHFAVEYTSFSCSSLTYNLTTRRWMLSQI